MHSDVSHIQPMDHHESTLQVKFPNICLTGKLAYYCELFKVWQFVCGLNFITFIKTIFVSIFKQVTITQSVYFVLHITAIRALDEWEVFLDNVNRKEIALRLLDFGLTNENFQFIFIRFDQT